MCFGSCSGTFCSRILKSYIYIYYILKMNTLVKALFSEGFHYLLIKQRTDEKTIYSFITTD